MAPSFGQLRGVALSLFFVVSAVLCLAFVLVPSYLLRGLHRSLHRRLVSFVFGAFWTVGALTAQCTQPTKEAELLGA
jgi:hypothetical protein